MFDELEKMMMMMQMTLNITRSSWLFGTLFGTSFGTCFEYGTSVGTYLKFGTGWKSKVQICTSCARHINAFEIEKVSPFDCFTHIFYLKWFRWARKQVLSVHLKAQKQKRVCNCTSVEIFSNSSFTCSVKANQKCFHECKIKKVKQTAVFFAQILTSMSMLHWPFNNQSTQLNLAGFLVS